MKLKIIPVAILVGLVAFSCQDEETQVKDLADVFNDQRLQSAEVNISDKLNARRDGSVQGFMQTVNEALAEYNLQLAVIEAYSMDGAGQTIFFNDRGNRQLDSDFVPGDPRRGGFTDIAYALDGTEGATSSGLTQEDTNEAIFSAMSTWDEVTCSNGLILTPLGTSPFDLGYVEALVTGGAQGSFFFTDLMHSGFNTTVTDAVFGPGSSVLGVTFTFIWTENGEPTDIDNNGKDDVALRDIYYNDSYSWAIGANVDVETVALHESGHGLSQAHFGKLFLNEANGKFQFAPRALMNAGYTGIQTTIGKSDLAGHCSNWAEWPGN